MKQADGHLADPQGAAAPVARGGLRGGGGGRGEARRERRGRLGLLRALQQRRHRQGALRAQEHPHLVAHDAIHCMHSTCSNASGQTPGSRQYPRPVLLFLFLNPLQVQQHKLCFLWECSLSTVSSLLPMYAQYVLSSVRVSERARLRGAGELQDEARAVVAADAQDAELWSRQLLWQVLPLIYPKNP